MGISDQPWVNWRKSEFDQLAEYLLQDACEASGSIEARLLVTSDIVRKFYQYKRRVELKDQEAVTERARSAYLEERVKLLELELEAHRG